MKSSVCVITWNRKEILEKTLPIHLANAKPGTILVISDNGSTDGTTEWLKENEEKWREEYSDIDFRIRYYKKNYGKLDLLLIDGDHSYEGVLEDYSTYSPLVRQGGVIALHDIAPKGPEQGVPKAWKTITEHIYGFKTYIEESNYMGIGVIIKE